MRPETRKPIIPRKSSTLIRKPDDTAFLMRLTYQMKETDRFTGVMVIARNVGEDIDPTRTVGDSVMWLNDVLRTQRDNVTGEERRLPDSQRYPRVVTDAEDPRLKPVDSVVISYDEMLKYAKALIKHGAVSYTGVDNLVPYTRYVANLKRKADGSFEPVASQL